MSEVVVEKREGIAFVTLNRPKVLNALSRSLRAELVRVFREIPQDEAVDAVILTGAGERAFSAGIDLRELAAENDRGGGLEDAVSVEHDVVRALEACDRPVIGAVNGYAITGGFELALACDVLVGSTKAAFADTHARVGILPGWGLSQKLSRLVGLARAKELSLTGNYLDAETACAWGLLNRVVAPEELLPTCERLARDMQSCGREMLRAYKRLIDEGFAATYAEGRRLEREASRAHGAAVTPERVATVRSRGRSQSARG